MSTKIRYSSLDDCPNRDLVAQVKSDVLSFGVLLLRLFCGMPVPQDDETLIKWVSMLVYKNSYIENSSIYIDSSSR